jgi:subtilisin family serine protease
VHRLRRLTMAGAVLSIALTAQTSSGWAERGMLPIVAAPAAPGRLIVKYRPRVSSCAHCLIAAGIPFSTITGSDSLDRLNRRLGVTSARPLFVQDHGFSGSRSAAFNAMQADIRSRFPLRSTRIPPTATSPDLSNIFVLQLPRTMDVEVAAALYSADPDVEYAHPDYELHTTFVPNDPYFSSHGAWGQPYDDLWGLKITQAPSAWDTASGAGMVVAVIDTGVDYTHPDLAGNMWTNLGEIPGNGEDDDGNGYIDDVYGWDFVTGQNDPMDQMGHGTHVAGTIAAVANNGIGVAGMAWGARLMAVRGLDSYGTGLTSDLAQAVTYAAANGADVLNASWGGVSFNLLLGESSALRDAIDAAASLGVVIVGAAGNDAGMVDAFEPAGYPNVIAVGATDYQDEHADFSNVGRALSVSAPGVDILSLRAKYSKNIEPYGHIVGTDYLVLSGTSMASPHVAGLGALILSVFPSLSLNEVRWHIELNADQPGYTGYEGEPWNPIFGWGRINAARAFTPPPITTRLHPVLWGLHDLITVDAYAGQHTDDASSADLTFTTRSPVQWNATTPSWLSAQPASGDGAQQVSLDIDATSLAPGNYLDTLAVSAPSAADGGATLPITLRAHSDPRIGAPVAVAADSFQDGLMPPPPLAVGNGTGTLVLWERQPLTDPDSGRFSPTMLSAHIDGAGGLHGPYVVDAGWYHTYPMVASDGRNFLLVWSLQQEYTVFPGTLMYKSAVEALRIGPDGQPLDAVTRELATITTRSPWRYVDPFGVAFNGSTYTVAWGNFNWGVPSFLRIFAVEVGTDGSVRRSPRKLFPNKVTAPSSPVRGYLPRGPSLSCSRTSCLLAWGFRSGKTDDNGYYVDQAVGVRLQGAKLQDSSTTVLLSNINLGAGYPLVAAADDGYLAAASRITCTGTLWTTCATAQVVSPLSADGLPINPDGILLDQYSLFGGLSYDGENYVATGVARNTNGTSQLFALRMGTDGHVIDQEQPGLLTLQASVGVVPWGLGASANSIVTGTPTHDVVTWVDTVNYDPNSLVATQSCPITSQAMLARSLPASMPVHAIGQIGAQAVAERSLLTFALSAPTLGGTISFTASSLPSGAIFDPTGIFRWMPGPDEAGFYPAVHFAASDGINTVSEDVDITVAEANLSISGTLQDTSGAPVAGANVKAGRRTVTTDAGGHYLFDDLAPNKRYTVRLARPTSKQYTATPRLKSVRLGNSDQHDVDLVLQPVT